MPQKKILSVFIDESGDFGKYEPHSPNYYVTMVFHEQSESISEPIKLLELPVFGGAAGSTALVNNLVMVTDNEKHLARLPNITIENWKQV